MNMSHIDPITGCQVADWYEIFTPTQMEELFTDMETDRKQTENDIKTDKLGLYKKLRAEGEEFGINIIKVIKIHDAKYSFTFRNDKTKIIAEIIAYDTYYKKTIHGKIQLDEYNFSGSFYEPPDYDINIYWLPHVSPTKVYVPKSILDDDWIKFGVNKYTLKRPDDVIKLHNELEAIFG